ncbi:MAG: sigma-70 family RNA polymerase sigma factor [Myxococcota bacterium]
MSVSRREYGRLVANLVRRFGVGQLASIEDAAQTAVLRAMERGGEGQALSPGWLYRVASNVLLDELRRDARRARLLARAPTTEESATDSDADLLRMLFICCHETLSPELQCALALKTLCGFSIDEVAVRLFTEPATVYKRIQRATKRLREHAPTLDALHSDSSAGVRSVRRVLYMLFSEGYLPSHQDFAIRAELCDEALRLTHVLADSRVGAVPETFALLALMHLNVARLPARVGPNAELLLLEEQDRDLWDPAHVQMGLAWLERAATGNVFSRFHAEAGIAALHCLAPSIKDTDWDQIAELYAMWEATSPSPMHRLARAIAVAEGQGPTAGLAVLADVEFPHWIDGAYQWHAVLADLHRRAGNRFEHHVELAISQAPSPAVQNLLRRRFRVS